MIAEDQSAVRAFLASGAGGERPAEIVETGRATVFLGARRVRKLRRAVRLPFADLSTPERRLAACEGEVARCRAAAPALYLGARAITRQADGRLEFDGPGPLVDAVVEMRRIAPTDLLERRVEAGELDPALAAALADEIARLHAAAPVRRDRGGAARICDFLVLGEAALAENRCIAPEEAAVLGARFREAAGRHFTRLDARAAEGRVRLGHGDLGLGAVCCRAGRPVVFACLDDWDARATADVLHDLAALLAELRHRGREASANRVMNRYLDAAGDEDGLPLLSFFMALRAAVGADVAERAGGDPCEVRARIDLARGLLDPSPVAVVCVSGPPRWRAEVAEAIAPRLGAGAGARLVRAGAPGPSPGGSPGEPPAAAAVAAPALAALAARVGGIAAGGDAVVVEGDFSRPANRAALAGSARAAGAPFLGVLPVAPEVAASGEGGPATGDGGDPATGAGDEGEWLAVTTGPLEAAGRVLERLGRDGLSRDRPTGAAGSR